MAKYGMDGTFNLEIEAPHKEAAQIIADEIVDTLRAYLESNDYLFSYGINNESIEPYEDEEEDSFSDEDEEDDE